MPDASLPASLRLSRHLSRFARREAVYLYHDLWGFLLEMSGDVLEFVEQFRDGYSVIHAIDKARFEPDQAAQFLRVLMRHQILLLPDQDEVQALTKAYPIRSPWAVALDRGADGVQLVVGRRPTGPRHSLVLQNTEAELWRALDGNRSCEDLADEFGEALSDSGASAAERLANLCQRIASWVHSDRQWLRLSEVPERFMAGHRPPYLRSTMPYPEIDGGELSDPFSEADGLVSNEHYHRSLVDGADGQFEDVETTLSHLFRDPHPALAGRSWGAAFFDVVASRGLWPGDKGSVVEVGGGLGWFAQRLLERAESKQALPASYRICDITPALQAAQRRRITPWSMAECVTVDAERLEVEPDSVDLLISNEVVADLRTAWAERAGDQWVDSAATRAATHWGLDLAGAPDRCALNVGAFDFVARISNVLKPGGAAVLTEFGGPDQYAIESTQLDHPEFSIHFGHLAQVARRSGLQAELVSVPKFIGLQGEQLALRSARTWWVNLRYLLAQHGVEITKRAWTKEAFEEAVGPLSTQLVGLQWQPLTERVMGLVPGEFWALIVRRPALPSETS